MRNPLKALQDSFDRAKRRKTQVPLPSPEEARAIDAQDEAHMPGTTHRPPRGTGG